MCKQRICNKEKRKKGQKASFYSLVHIFCAKLWIQTENMICCELVKISLTLLSYLLKCNHRDLVTFLFRLFSNIVPKTLNRMDPSSMDLSKVKDWSRAHKPFQRKLCSTTLKNSPQSVIALKQHGCALDLMMFCTDAHMLWQLHNSWRMCKNSGLWIAAGRPRPHEGFHAEIENQRLLR